MHLAVIFGFPCPISNGLLFPILVPIPKILKFWILYFWVILSFFCTLPFPHFPSHHPKIEKKTKQKTKTKQPLPSKTKQNKKTIRILPANLYQQYLTSCKK